MWPRSLRCSTAFCITGMCSSAAREVGGQKLQPLLREVLNESEAVRLAWSKTKSEEGFLTWGRCPQTPGIYRLPARMALLGGGWRRPAIPAAGSALGSHPCVALSSAQVRLV